MRPSPSVLTIALLLAATPAAAQFDRSCNALQLTKLNTQLGRLSSSEQTRFAPQAASLRRQMDALFDQSRQTEREFAQIERTHLEALLTARAALAERYAKQALKEKPDLSQEALQLEVYARLMADPAFTEELQRRILKDPSHDAVATQAFRDQSGAYHDLEQRLYRQVLQAPPPAADYDAQMEIAAVRYFEQRQGPVVLTAAGSTPAMRELAATLDAVQQGSRASLSAQRVEPLASTSRLVWDTPGDAVVVATEELRRAVRGVESVRLRADLDYMHIPNALAPPSDRAEQMRQGTRLSQAVAKTASRAIQDRVAVREAYKRLDRIAVPPPPPASADAAATGDWKARAAAAVKKAAETVTIIYTLE